jgi:hypothetical protein
LFFLFFCFFVFLFFCFFALFFSKNKTLFHERLYRAPRYKKQPETEEPHDPQKKRTIRMLRRAL